MAKTSCRLFLSRKGDIAELPPSPISMSLLKCLSVKVLRLQYCFFFWGGGGGGGCRDKNVRGKENV